jgi:hypothetical protein
MHSSRIASVQVIGGGADDDDDENNNNNKLGIYGIEAGKKSEGKACSG